MKFIIKSSLICVFILFTSGIFARQADSVNPLPEEGEQIIDTLLTKDTLSLESQLFPDENLNDIFSEKMDSLEDTWFIENAFTLDTTEITFIKTYPKNIPDSIYIQRLQDIEQVVDLSYNNVVRNFIKLYTEKKRELSEVIIGLSYYYFPIFEETLDKYDMPLELKYLAIIESALNPMARSRVGANGMWQFMYGTAKNMDLEITSFVDERRDPLKSTDAAARYLKKLYGIYGDWHLAIAAYNCGPGNVNRAIRRSGGKKNYWDIYYRLPRETRGYVPAFIAASYFMNYYGEHNLLPHFPEVSINTDTVIISDYLHFDQLSATLGITKEELRSLNPMYRRDVIPAKDNKPYPVVLPENKIMDFIDKDTLVFAHEREKYFPDNTLMKPTESPGYFTPVDIEGKAKVIYTVKSGDNVGFISSWFHVRTSDLRYWNNIHRDLIRIGQKLVVYVPEKQKAKYDKVNTMTFAQKQEMVGKKASTATKSELKPQDPDYVYYTVKRGDTLWDIAQKYAGISSNEIMKLNNLSSGRGLYIGQKLKIKRKI
jgi:membrane-bound lytic murein transglycosylase D